ncbi:MAG: hypothetical protein ABSG70_14000 [Terriglobales bacterium]
MRNGAVVLLSFFLVAPAFAKLHKDSYPVPCSTLWPAVKDTLKNSGKYAIVGIDNGEMTASYIIGSFFSGRRINSVVLNATGDGCDMQTQTTYTGVERNDAGDFKKRVDESLAKLKTAEPSPAAPHHPGTQVRPLSRLTGYIEILTALT